MRFTLTQKSCIVFGILILIVGCCCGRSDLSQPFSSSKWKAGDADARGAMACDLTGIEPGDWGIHNSLEKADKLASLSKEKVEELLGPPEFEGAVSKPDGTEYVFHYNLGFLDQPYYEQVIEGDAYTLFIGFDKNDEVIAVFISR